MKRIFKLYAVVMLFDAAIISILRYLSLPEIYVGTLSCGATLAMIEYLEIHK